VKPASKADRPKEQAVNPNMYYCAYQISDTLSQFSHKEREQILSMVASTNNLRVVGLNTVVHHAPKYTTPGGGVTVGDQGHFSSSGHGQKKGKKKGKDHGPSSPKKKVASPQEEEVKKALSSAYATLRTLKKGSGDSAQVAAHIVGLKDELERIRKPL